MQDLPVHPTDLALIAIVLISGALAFSRGFVKEVLSIAGWIGAAFAAFYALPVLRPYVSPHIENAFLADAAVVAAVFLVTLVFLSLLSSAIANRVRQSEINALDRSLGFLFGLARGAVVIALAYLILVQFVPREEHPDWIREARALPVVEYCAVRIASVMPEEIAEGLKVAEKLGTGASDAIEAGKRLDAIRRAAEPEAADSPGESGYKDGERRQLDRLFGTSREN